MGDAPVVTSVLKDQETPLYTFDDLIRQRAIDEDQSALVAYPKTKLGITDYELFTGRDLNRFVDGAAKSLIAAGIEPVYESQTIGICGPSDLDYAITIFGLGRLGYTTFLLSPRLPVIACVNLLQGANAVALLFAPQFNDLASKTAAAYPLKLLPILTRSQYDSPNDTSPAFARTGIVGSEEALKKFIMMHSSGSTGLPRPIDYTHKRLMGTLLTAQNLVAFQSVPLFHAHGFVSFVQAIYKRKTIYLFNGRVPQTHDTITAAIRAVKPELVWTVPYVLKLLAEKQDGIEALKACKIVACTGSRCTDDLGNLLVNQGIHLGVNFGATEVAFLFSSLNRPREDKAWDYMRAPPHVVPYIYMKPVDGNICECVVLDGHRGKVMSNSNDPPNSFHTKDLFIAHETIPNSYKFVGRLDDRVTLSNGEKVLPLPMEGRIRQHPLVKEAVIFGIDRPVPGLLLFRSTNAAGLTDEEFIDQVWSAIEEANSNAEAFGHISREMVAVIPEDRDCPSTDKSSIKRAQVYREFSSVIDGIYSRLENSAGGGSLQLTVPELEQWIMSSFAELGIHLSSTSVDFFTAGVDSLKAIQMRGLIVNNIDLGGHVSRCASMIVYDCGNTERLAKALYSIRMGERDSDEADGRIHAMSAMIEQFSSFPEYIPGGQETPTAGVVVLTGATGSLGSHVLTWLVEQQSVAKIYCLLRISSGRSPEERLSAALKDRELSPLSSKITPLVSDLSAPDLGLSPQMFMTLKSETTHIIHCAWAVNFALPLQSFAPQVAALQNLVKLSLSVPFTSPAHLLFCSSIATALGTAAPALIPSAPLTDLHQSTGTGYSDSKLVAERLIQAAVEHAHARATIFRIGQIIPSPTTGSRLWNPDEAIPLLIRSAVIVGALPDRLASGDACAWISVDDVAQTILELGGLAQHANQSGDIKSQLVYNLVHPKPFSWRKDLLPALRAAGLDFEIVSYEVWLERLSASDDDVQKNPSRKLLGFWREREARDTDGEIRFDTSDAEAMSRTFGQAGSIIQDNFVRELLQAWRAVW